MVALGLSSDLSRDPDSPQGVCVCACVPSMSEFHFPLGISSGRCYCPILWHSPFPFPLKSVLSVNDSEE